MEYIYFKENEMANEGKFVEGLAKTLALVGGAYLFVELIKAFAKKETIFSCPKCGSDIKYGENPCHCCKTNLSWNFENPNKNI